MDHSTARPTPRRRACTARSLRSRVCASTATPGPAARPSARGRASPPGRRSTAARRPGRETAETRTRRGSPVRTIQRERPLAPRRPPATPHGRCRDDADGDLAVLLERQQGGPHRHPAHVALGAVDRVDDPPPLAVPVGEPAAKAPYSSPKTASPGRSVTSRSRRACSTARSASETGVRSGLVSTTRSSARKRESVISSAMSASCSASARSSEAMTRCTGDDATPIPCVPMGADDLQRECVELLQQLIRFDTVNPPGNERPAIEHLERYLQTSRLRDRDPGRRSRSGPTSSPP